MSLWLLCTQAMSIIYVADFIHPNEVSDTDTRPNQLSFKNRYSVIFSPLHHLNKLVSKISYFPLVDRKLSSGFTFTFKGMKLYLLSVNILSRVCRELDCLAPIVSLVIGVEIAR